MLPPEVLDARDVPGFVVLGPLLEDFSTLLDLEPAQLASRFERCTFFSTFARPSSVSLLSPCQKLVQKVAIPKARRV